MTKQITTYVLSCRKARHAVTMPRRARITGAVIKGQSLTLYAEVEHDADTKQLDTGTWQRHFELCTTHDVVPEGGLVAFEGGIHVYEVKGEAKT